MTKHVPPRFKALAVTVIGHPTRYFRIQGGFAVGLPGGLQKMLGPGPARSGSAPGVHWEVCEIGADEYGRIN